MGQQRCCEHLFHSFTVSIDVGFIVHEHGARDAMGLLRYHDTSIRGKCCLVQIGTGLLAFCA